jgi:hypothetical protein
LCVSSIAVFVREIGDSLNTILSLVVSILRLAIDQLKPNLLQNINR